jgi:cytochrome b6-f complex iron-sulfur subunit
MIRRRTDHIDAVLADRKLPDTTLNNPDDIDALTIAIELRAARPGAGQPDEAFIIGLQRRLTEQTTPANHRVHITRRAAFTAGAGALAGAAAAAFVAVETSTPATNTASVNLDLPDGRWTPITSIEALATQPVTQFVTTTITGYVSLQPDGTPIAVNARCTHQGCLLRPSPTGNSLDCPCHRTTFAPDGTLLTHQLPTPPAPLTRLHTRRQNNTIEALLPPD